MSLCKYINNADISPIYIVKYLIMFDLKGFRKEFQLKQSDVAELFNIGQSSISEIDNLKRDLTEEQKAIIKKKYGLDMFEKYNIEETSLEIVYDNPKGPNPVSLIRVGSFFFFFSECYFNITPSKIA